MEPSAGTQGGASAQEPDTVQTTQEELDGLNIIRAILCELIEPKRISMRDAKSYCAILFDDNNRKPICRLRFNNPDKLFLGLFDEKEEQIIPINDCSAIYKYSDRLRKTISTYIENNSPQINSQITGSIG